MRILYHHRILARDGMRVHVDELVAGLRRQGHDVAVAGPEPDGPDASPAAGLTAHLARLRGLAPGWVGELMEMGYNFKAHRALVAQARQYRPDVLYERYNSFLTAGVRVKRVLGLPYIIEVNAPLAYERASLGNLAFRRTAERMERAVWRAADAVLTVSDALADFVRAAGVPEDRIVVIPNGVRLDAYTGERDRAVRAELGLDGRTVFGFVGFVRPWHGLDRVLRAFARLGDPRLHLLVVGEGPASEALAATAADLGIADRLTFTGTQPHDAIPRLLSAVDVALQPDVTAYASPLKLFEYMAAGCAVIAPDRANIREIVRHGETALLFDPEDDGALERRIVTLADDAALRDRLGRAARAEIVARDYTWQGNARRVEAIAERLLAGKAAKPDVG